MRIYGRTVPSYSEYRGEISVVRKLRRIRMCSDFCCFFTLTCIITPRLINLGRRGSFYANELIAQPYGLTYEIVDRRLSVVAPRTFQEIGRKSHSRMIDLNSLCTEDTDATNELISDSQLVQPLTLSEIEELKRSGAHASVRSW
jgi:hypothetical protein